MVFVYSYPHLLQLVHSLSDNAMLSRFSRVRLCVTPWTAAHQAPPSTGFSRQEYWSGVPFPSPYLLQGWSQTSFGFFVTFHGKPQQTPTIGWYQIFLNGIVVQKYTMVESQQRFIHTYTHTHTHTHTKSNSKQKTTLNGNPRNKTSRKATPSMMVCSSSTCNS